MEGRVVPASTIVGAFGAGAGGGPVVTVLFDDGSHLSFFAFDPSFRGGACATLGRVDGTGVPDVIVGAGPGGSPDVKVFDGAQLLAGNPVATANFFAFDTNFSGGVSLAAGPVNGTGHDDVVVGAGSGKSSAVKVFDGASLAQGNATATASFLAFPGVSDWVSLTVAPVNGTGHSDVIVSAGRGAPPEVKVIDGAKLAQGQEVVTADFMAFAPTWSGGITVAAGHIEGADHADVVVAPGPGGGPNVKVFDGTQLAAGSAVATASFFAFDPAFTGGVSLATGDINGTGHDDLVVGAGPGGGPIVNVFDGQQLATGQAVATTSFFVFPSDYRDGVQVNVVPFPGHGRDLLNVIPDPGGGPVAESFDGAQLAAGNAVPLYSFFAFDPSFRGGLNLGFVFAASFLDPAFHAALLLRHPSGGGGGFGTSSGLFGPFVGFGGFGGFSTSGFSGFSGFSSGGFSGFSGSSGGFSGSGGSGGFSGGSGSGGSLRAAGGRGSGFGGKAPGGGSYLAPGQVTLANAGSGREPSSSLGGNAARFVTPGELRVEVGEAVGWWEQAGISPAEDQRLRAVEVRVAGLGGDVLGRAGGGVITLSSTAAGYGWSVDTRGTGEPAPGRMDLPTVLAHEMGHVLGLEHTELPGDVMDSTLPTGVRRVPTPADVNGIPPNPGS